WYATYMTKHSVLIIGGGYLGNILAKLYREHYYAVEVLDFPQIDITKFESIHEAMRNRKPTMVINCAAFTNTNEAEKREHHDITAELNVYGALTLAYALHEHGIPLIHFSTAMMFDGDKDGTGW